MTLPLLGQADNGARGKLACDFYTGPVGVRQRGETLELAWPGNLGAAQLPMTGTLDGQAITISSIARSATSSKMIIATADVDR